MNIAQYQQKQNFDDLPKLRYMGFKISFDENGYSVFFKDKFLGGVSVKLPREKPLKGCQGYNNRVEFLDQAIIVAKRSKFYIDSSH